MSVIAWDGNTIAADRLCSGGGIASEVRKLFDTKYGFIGFSGDYAHIKQFLYWFVEEEHAPDKVPAFQLDKQDYLKAMWVDNAGEIYIFENNAYPFALPNTKQFAIGSGGEIALGAMAAGACAIKAVKITSDLNIYCGKGYDSFILN